MAVPVLTGNDTSNPADANIPACPPDIACGASAHANRQRWHTAVIYQVYLRSFADANGDGIGDLAGLRERLPYLAWLGVDALWLTPHYPSGGADGGYDVADYRAVGPDFARPPTSGRAR